MLGTFRAHQVPLATVRENPDHLRLLENWLRSYRPDELFEADGSLSALVRRANPDGALRMSATPHANGGVLTRALDLPDFRDYAVDVAAPAGVRLESTRRFGEMLRDIYSANPDRFRLFCPDETNSNRLGAVFEVSDRAFAERVTDNDLAFSQARPRHGGAVRAHCHGWLEGYTLTGGTDVRDVRGVRDGQRVADDPAQQVARRRRAHLRGGRGARA
jgi:xylulose-5-phosphate/fructose-6-phosphate phosphoketolase